MLAVSLVVAACGRSLPRLEADEPLPFEVYGLLPSPETEAERAQARRFEVAVDEAIAACMRLDGFEYVVAPPRPFEEDDPVTSGAPLDEQRAWVERYGYGVSTRFDAESLEPEALRAYLDGGVGDDPVSALMATMTPDERIAWAEAEAACEEHALATVPPPNLPEDEQIDPTLLQTISEVLTAAANDPRYQQADSLWEACMRRRGWEFRSHRDAVDGVVDRLWHVLELLLVDDPTAEDELRAVQAYELALAADDHACYADEVLPVRRAVDREYQLRFIAEHGDLLPEAVDGG